MYPLDNVCAQLITAALGFGVLKFLPQILKRTGFMTAVGTTGMMYIYVGAILYLGIVHIIVPLGGLVAHLLMQVTGFRV